MIRSLLDRLANTAGLSPARVVRTVGACLAPREPDPEYSLRTRDGVEVARVAGIEHAGPRSRELARELEATVGVYSLDGRLLSEAQFTGARRHPALGAAKR